MISQSHTQALRRGCGATRRAEVLLAPAAVDPGATADLAELEARPGAPPALEPLERTLICDTQLLIYDFHAQNCVPTSLGMAARLAPTSLRMAANLALTSCFHYTLLHLLVASNGVLEF